MEIGIVVAVVLVVLLVAVVLVVLQRRRRRQLQERFGPEYQHVVENAQSRRQGEKELIGRERRRDALEIRPLSPGARHRFAEAWTSIQARFVDAPADAVGEAQHLLNELMGERGYPVEDFEQQASDISVDHPALVENYRAAHRVSQENRRGAATTETLRQAMVHYRSLFDELLVDDGETGARPTDSEGTTRPGRSSSS
jgi:hypothetical protein